MKKLLFLSILTFSVLSSFAQKAVILESFKKYGIDPSILDSKSKERPSNYAFDYKYTSVTGNKEVVTIAKFDPSKPEEERWTVISVKGKAPSSSDIKSFRKNHGKAPVNATTDESTYKIEKVNAGFLVISYKQDPASMPAEAAFMKDCKLYMTINLKNKR